MFVDGGYLVKVSAAAGTRVDVGKLAAKIRGTLAESTFEPLELIRTYYYDCLPYQGNPPTPEEASRFSQKRRFFAALQPMPSSARAMRGDTPARQLSTRRSVKRATPRRSAARGARHGWPPAPVADPGAGCNVSLSRTCRVNSQPSSWSETT